MDLLIDFYKELDTLNLIIFWGIIIVIILVIILIIILICKKRKQKNIEDNNHDNHSLGEIPIKKETIDILPTSEIKQEEISSVVLLHEENKISEEPIRKLSNLEEQQTLFPENNILKEKQENNTFPKMENNGINEVTQTNSEKKITSPIEIPSKPYQKNVLREMSLSQTSPIGINRYVPQENNKDKMIKDLDEALNNKDFINASNEIEIKNNKTNNYIEKTNEEQKNLNTETKIYSNNQIKEEIPAQTKENQRKIINESKNGYTEFSTPARDLLINNSIINDNTKISDSEKYLEEVSKKLSNAEIPSEIERTIYEIKQEEDAIISYKELMEKKDSIQTIDEEDAIISIEELMNKNLQKVDESKEESKLYNINEEEANENFIKELKQFRNDL